MWNPDLKERYRQMIEAARRQEAVRAQALSAREPGPQAGDLYATPVPTRAAVAIALTHSHPKDPESWFAVAADDYIEAGSTDVVIPEAALWGPLVLRCGHGLWLRADVLAELRRLGFIPDAYARDAANRLALLVRGQYEPTAKQEEVEDDPDYQKWIHLLDNDHRKLERWRDGRGMVLKLADFRPEAPDPLRTLPAADWPAPGQILAASSGGLLDSLAEVFGDEPTTVWQTVPGPGGELVLRAGGAGVDAFWIGDPSSMGKPPRLRGRSADGRTVAARWKAVPSLPNCLEARITFPWVEGMVTLLVGPGKGETVVVRR